MEWYQVAKSLIQNAGFTQEQLAPVFGVKTRAAVGHYLCGRRHPRPDQLKKLADFLGVRIDDFFVSEAQQSEIEIQNVPSGARRLATRYAWSNPDGVSDEALIFNVLSAGRFEDVLDLCLHFSYERVAEFVESDEELAGMPRLQRLLNNIKQGRQAALNNAA